MGIEEPPSRRTPWRTWAFYAGGILMMLAVIPFAIGSARACTGVADAYLYLVMACIPVQLAGPFAFPPVASTLFRSMLSVLAVGLTLLVALAAFLGADLFQLCRLF